jgi:hypothetical protein
MVRYETRGGLATTCHHRQVRDSLEAGCGLLPPGVDAEGRLWRFDVRSLQPATPYELRLTDQSSLLRLDGLRLEVLAHDPARRVAPPGRNAV